MKYKNIREEELKNKVGADWFKSFDTTEIFGNVDFTVFPKQVNIFGRTPLLWAEAKTGNFDVPTMFVQLVLTIGKARTFDKTLPPAFLGAFDFKKIAFVPYISVPLIPSIPIEISLATYNSFVCKCSISGWRIPHTCANDFSYSLLIEGLQ